MFAANPSFPPPPRPHPQPSTPAVWPPRTPVCCTTAWPPRKTRSPSWRRWLSWLRKAKRQRNKPLTKLNPNTLRPAARSSRRAAIPSSRKSPSPQQPDTTRCSPKDSRISSRSREQDPSTGPQLELNHLAPKHRRTESQIYVWQMAF